MIINNFSQFFIMKNYVSLTVSILTLIVLTGCIPPDDQPLPPQNNEVPTEDISATVDTYMKLTLGSIPGSNIDYERAKQYLTPGLAAQFTTPMFIPASYCMQDGPSDVRVTSVTFNVDSNMAHVIVEGAYGEWKKLWDFTVVPVEGGHWMINMITCLGE